MVRDVVQELEDLGLPALWISEGLRREVCRERVAPPRCHTPDQSPAPSAPPFRVLAAVGPKMLETACRRSTGAHPYFVVPEHTSAARDALGPGRLLCPEQAVVLWPDPERAASIARDYAQLYLQFPSYRNDLKQHGFVDADFEHGCTLSPQSAPAPLAHRRELAPALLSGAPVRSA